MFFGWFRKKKKENKQQWNQVPLGPPPGYMYASGQKLDRQPYVEEYTSRKREEDDTSTTLLTAMTIGSLVNAINEVSPGSISNYDGEVVHVDSQVDNRVEDYSSSDNSSAY